MDTEMEMEMEMETTARNHSGFHLPPNEDRHLLFPHY